MNAKHFLTIFLVILLVGCGSPGGNVQNTVDSHPLIQKLGFPFKVVKETNGIITIQGPNTSWHNSFVGRAPRLDPGNWAFQVSSNGYQTYLARKELYNGALRKVQELARTVNGVKDVVWTPETKRRS